jgi:diguanylate cyclase (GGDEF)-like protein
MIDVDYFKSFNDRYGHLAGDSILKLLAGTLTKFSRPRELVGRYGGEEFLSILKDTDLEGAVRYGERIRSKVSDLGRLLSNRFPEHDLSVSVGVAEFMPALNVREQLIDMADKAMYTAKVEGRNRVMKAWMESGGETQVGPGDG